MLFALLYLPLFYDKSQDFSILFNPTIQVDLAVDVGCGRGYVTRHLGRNAVLQLSNLYTQKIILTPTDRALGQETRRRGLLARDARAMPHARRRGGRGVLEGSPRLRFSERPWSLRGRVRRPGHLQLEYALGQRSPWALQGGQQG